MKAPNTPASVTSKSFELPGFELAAMNAISPETVVPKEGDAREESFFLALALVFNDMKGLALFSHFLNHSNHERAEVSPRAGQWSGMAVQLDRLLAGMLWELLALIKAHEDVVGTRTFNDLVDGLSKESRASWKTIRALAVDGSKGRDPFALALCRIRNAGTFHYYAPKAVAAGFRSAFFENPSDERLQSALVSVGKDLEATRFYYADAAVQVCFQNQAAAAGVKDYKRDLQRVYSAANTALYSLVTCYLLRKQGQGRPRPPIKGHGSGDRKRARK